MSILTRAWPGPGLQFWLPQCMLLERWLNNNLGWLTAEEVKVLS